MKWLAWTILILLLPTANAVTIPAAIDSSYTNSNSQSDTFVFSMAGTSPTFNLSNNFSDSNTTLGFGFNFIVTPHNEIFETNAEYSLTFIYNTSHTMVMDIQYVFKRAAFVYPYFDTIYTIKNDNTTICTSQHTQLGFLVGLFSNPYYGKSLRPTLVFGISWGPQLNTSNAANPIVAPGTLAITNFRDGYDQGQYGRDCPSRFPSDSAHVRSFNFTDLSANPTLLFQTYNANLVSLRIDYGFETNATIQQLIATGNLAGTSCSNAGNSTPCPQSTATICDGFIPIFGSGVASTGVSVSGFLQWIGGVGFCVGSNLIKPIFEFIKSIAGFIKDGLLALFPGLGPLIILLSIPIAGTIDLLTLLFQIYIQSGSQYGPGGVYWTLLLYSLDVGLAMWLVSGELSWAWRAPLAFLQFSTIGVALMLYWLYYKLPVLAFDTVSTLIRDYRG